MSADYAPRAPFLARPYSSVAISTSRDFPRNFHNQSRTERSDRDVLPNASNAQFLRFVRAKANNSRRVGIEILCFGSELTLRAGEQKAIGDQTIESRHVRRELRRAQLGLERSDFGVRVRVQHPFYSSGLI